MLGQTAVQVRSDEIEAIPGHLEKVAPTGVLVTIDATGRQRDIASEIRDRGGEPLALRSNQPALFDDVSPFLPSTPEP